LVIQPGHLGGDALYQEHILSEHENPEVGSEAPVLHLEGRSSHRKGKESEACLKERFEVAHRGADDLDEMQGCPLLI